jgi:hypothetical protein
MNPFRIPAFRSGGWVKDSISNAAPAWQTNHLPVQENSGDGGGAQISNSSYENMLRSQNALSGYAQNVLSGGLHVAEFKSLNETNCMVLLCLKLRISPAELSQRLNRLHIFVAPEDDTIVVAFMRNGQLAQIASKADDFPDADTINFLRLCL